MYYFVSDSAGAFPQDFWKKTDALISRCASNNRNVSHCGKSIEESFYLFGCVGT